MAEPEWVDAARAMRAECPPRSWNQIGRRLGVGAQMVRYWVVKKEKYGHGDKRGPGKAGAERLSAARRGSGNPAYVDGRRSGETPGRQRFKSPDLMCQVCLRRGHHEHHVIYQQELRKRRVDEYDPQNAMKLCISCHSSHHRRGRVIETVMLHDRHINYAFATLGAYAYDYLRSHYDDSAGDPRIEAGLAAASRGTA